MDDFEHKYRLNRLEVSNKTYDVKEGIQVKLKDPLWLLGRQWQTGEFLASNGGYPVRMEAVYQFEAPQNIVKLQDASQGASVGHSLDLSDPLEKQVEDEQESSAWDNRHLEYSFKINQPNFELVSEEYTGKSLDWYHFLLSRNTIARSSSPQVTEVVPNPIKYHGMPSPRWWNFEDGVVNLGDTSRPHFNLLTVLLVEFGLLSSQEWYHIPIQHRVGHLRKMLSVKIVDSFGIVTAATPIQDQDPNHRGFELFTLATQANQAKDSSLFYLPNNLTYAQESSPLEEISFFRDEMANLVWAIEHRYEKTPDEIVNRHEENNTAEEPEQEQVRPLYVQKQAPPVHWIPYVLQQWPEGVFLKRGRTYPHLNHTQHEGSIIRESSLIFEEEITNSGIKISRVKQLARRIGDGRLCTWTGRKKEVDRPQPFSNLAFDQLKNPL